MNPRYGQGPKKTGGLYLALAGGVVLVIAVVILVVVFKKPPAPEGLKLMVEDYFKAVEKKELHKAYEIERLRGELHLARYVEAMEKEYELKDQVVVFKTITVSPAQVTGTEATVDWGLDIYDSKTERTTNKRGRFKFIKHKDGWQKEPGDFLLEALEEQKKLTASDR
ncbi:MAG: hypothetical protein JW909_05055 [Planctomycetes bacterium]|nr:hypothetical protein [Planctomycetota bacterium]